MENILNLLKEISHEFGFELFFHEETNEAWMSGYKDKVKFDLYVRPQRDGTYKMVFEIPFDKKVCLFLQEEGTVNRIKDIFYNSLYFPKFKDKEDITNGVQSYATN